jgi:hypothetical protein
VCATCTIPIHLVCARALHAFFGLMPKDYCGLVSFLQGFLLTGTLGNGLKSREPCPGPAFSHVHGRFLNKPSSAEPEHWRRTAVSVSDSVRTERFSSERYCTQPHMNADIRNAVSWSKSESGKVIVRSPGEARTISEAQMRDGTTVAMLRRWNSHIHPIRTLPNWDPRNPEDKLLDK